MYQTIAEALEAAESLRARQEAADAGMADREGSLLNSPENASGRPVVIRLDPGRYHEKIEIRIPGLCLEGCGQNPEDTFIEYDDFARQIMPDGEKRGTFRSYTMFIDAPAVELYNLTVQNSAGPGSKVGQAIALYAEGEGIRVLRCRLIGSQDTLFTGPLPEKEIEPGGFRGPKEFAPRINGRQYYRDTYICGGVDFIFGSATAWFENCTIESLDEGRGYVTAASTPEGQRYGYIFNRCRFIGNPDTPAFFLGRPWRDYARTVIMNSWIGAHICPQGFDDWGKENARRNAFYAEYRNYGPGAADGDTPRAGWVHELTEEEAMAYTPGRVFG